MPISPTPPSGAKTSSVFPVSAMREPLSREQSTGTGAERNAHGLAITRFGICLFCRSGRSPSRGRHSPPKDSGPLPNAARSCRGHRSEMHVARGDPDWSAARADHEAAVFVDGLEHTPHDIAVDAH